MAKDALKAAGWQFHLQNDLVDEFSDGVRQFDCRTPRRVSTEHLRMVPAVHLLKGRGPVKKEHLDALEAWIAKKEATV